MRAGISFIAACPPPERSIPANSTWPRAIFRACPTVFIIMPLAAMDWFGCAPVIFSTRQRPTLSATGQPLRQPSCSW